VIRSFFVNSILFIVTLLVILLIGEIGIRAYLKFAYQPTEQGPESPYLEVLPDSGRAYALRPDSGISGLNSSGFRGRELSVDKPDNVFRIVMLGDSVIFGTGVEWNETLPYYLEQQINRLGNSPSFEVYNLGIPGYNTSQELATLREVGLQLQPDLVILNICLNDSDPVKDVWSAGLVKKARIATISDINLRTIVGASYFLTFIKKNAVEVIKQYRPDVLDTLNSPALFLNKRVIESAWSEMKQDMLDIERESSASGARFIATIFPYKSQVSLSREDLDPQNDLIGFFQDRGIKVFDTTDLYKNADKEMFSDHTLHLSAYGGERVANGLLEFLLDSGFVTINTNSINSASSSRATE